MPRLLEKASIIELLSGIRKGSFLEHLNEQLGELVAAVHEHEASGELTITLKFRANGESQAVVQPRCKIKKPTRTVGDAIFYTTPTGGLERDDPRQADFEFDSLKR